MKKPTENYILLQFERKQNIKHQGKRLFEDIKIIENMALNLSVQKSKIVEILVNNNFVMDIK